MTPHVAMLLTTPYGPDVRVQKEAHTLALAGYRVSVIAWDRAANLPQQAVETIPAALLAELDDWPGRTVERPEPVTITRIRVRAGYRTGQRLLRTMPRFWWQALNELRRCAPDVVHANDLDTLPLAYAYRRLSGTPFVYDAREYYPGMVRDSVGVRFSHWLDRLDRWLTPRADAVVTVGERLAERLRGMGGRVWVVHNSQPRPADETFAEQRIALRGVWGVPDGALVVVYAGYLTAERLIGPMLQAVEAPGSGLEDVWLVVAGDGPQMGDVRAAAARCSRIKSLAWVALDHVPAIVAAGDVAYYGLDARNPNSTYFMPNLAFFALAAGRPLLTTPVGEVAEIVQREGCGLVLDVAEVGAVRDALDRLRQQDTYALLAARARSMAQESYRWRAAAGALLEAYEAAQDRNKCEKSKKYPNRRGIDR